MQTSDLSMQPIDLFMQAFHLSKLDPDLCKTVLHLKS